MNQSQQKCITTQQKQMQHLKEENSLLKKDLSSFEKRLDVQLKKKHKRKYSLKHNSSADIMELKNAYKQIEIYKKEIKRLQKKAELHQEEKVQSLTAEVLELKRDRQGLLQEIKSLKKINKFQSKGLIGFKESNYVKLLEENDKLKQQLKNLTSAREETSPKKYTLKKKERMHSQEEASMNKIIKCEKQIKRLQFENRSFRDIIDSLKLQLQYKDKETSDLRSKLKQEPKSRRIHTQQNQQSRIVDEFELKKQNFIKKYPKILEKGSKTPHSMKWNHHQFNSKIKEVQICPHSNGHIKSINFRYEKGEPPRSNSGKYSSFFCAENDEYVKMIEGGFMDGLLQYILITTSQQRKSKFCNFHLQKECEEFSFGGGEHQYLGAFFGQGTSEGIVKIGCYVDTLKKQ